jgi:hypothetical protein
MCEIDIIRKRRKTLRVLHDYVKSGPLDPLAVLLDREVVAARRATGDLGS